MVGRIVRTALGGLRSRGFRGGRARIGGRGFHSPRRLCLASGGRASGRTARGRGRHAAGSHRGAGQGRRTARVSGNRSNRKMTITRAGLILAVTLALAVDATAQVSLTPPPATAPESSPAEPAKPAAKPKARPIPEIGRASCRERG